MAVVRLRSQQRNSDLFGGWEEGEGRVFRDAFMDKNVWHTINPSTAQKHGTVWFDIYLFLRRSKSFCR